MKFQLFTLILVIAGAYAMPPASDDAFVDSSNQPAPTIIVDDIIRRIIKFISTGIKKVGLDPLIIEKKDIKFPPVPKVVTVKGYIRDLTFDGVSNVQITTLDYSVLHSKLSFDISLPKLSFLVGDSGTEVVLFDKEYHERFNGSLFIESIRLTGEITVDVSNINNISLRSVTLNFSVGDITSNLMVSALGKDYSDKANHFLNETVPNILKKYEDVINKFLEGIVKAIFKVIN